MHRHATIVTFACLLTASLFAGPTDRKPADHKQWIESQSTAIAQQLRDGAYDDARSEAAKLFDYAVAYVPARQTDLFLEAAFYKRLTDQLSRADTATREALTPFLLDHPKLARTLVFVVDEGEDPKQVLATLAKLHAAVGDELAEQPTLAAAMAVVHDKPLVRRINENTVKAVDPVELYKFYVDNERRMLFGLKAVPAELLTWVVDSTATVEEMEWALKRYAGDRNVGKRFFDIKYDYDHYTSGRTKRVTTEGFNLPNILKYGGVCADQAYFAMSVGKAIGVPTAYTVARGGTVGHAWVGFLMARGRQGMWNFDTGRYDAYQGIRGNIVDPQTGQRIPDSYVSLLAELIGTSSEDRWAAVAMTDAAVRLAASKTDPLKPVTPDDAELPAAREPTSAERLDLLEAGLRKNPGNARGWFVMTAMAEEGAMDLAQKKTWAEVLQKLTGRNYPDFTLAVLRPMISSIADIDEQNKLWEAAFRLVLPRKDLAAEVRVLQGQMWQEAGEVVKAGRCYEDVIQKFVNDGPFAIDALRRTEKMLVESGRESRVVRLYATTWRRCSPPRGMAPEFAKQSNWFNIGLMYADRLKNADRHDEADQVRQVLQETIRN